MDVQEAKEIGDALATAILKDQAPPKDILRRAVTGVLVDLARIADALEIIARKGDE